GEWERRLREAEQALVSAQHAARDAVARRDDLASRRDAMRESLASARDTISQTTYRIDSLRTLLTSLESQDEEVRRAILELIPNAMAAAEAVRATEGFEAALDALLRDVSKAVVVDDAQTALEAIARLRERGASGAISSSAPGRSCSGSRKTSRSPRRSRRCTSRRRSSSSRGRPRPSTSCSASNRTSAARTR